MLRIRRRRRCGPQDFGHRDQEIVNAFEDLVQLGRGELCLPQGHFIDFSLTGAAKVELVIGLDRQGREKGDKNKQE